MTITIDLPELSPLDSIGVKIAVEKIAKNFDKDNLSEIAELSTAKDVNSKFKKLLNNQIIKAMLK